MYTIKIFFEEGKESVVLKQVEAGESLLEIFLAYGIELGHECGGICSCTTCCLYIEKGNDFLEPTSRRENDVLGMRNKRSGKSRLGCQSLLLEGSGELEVTIPTQTKTRTAPPAE